MSLDRAYGNFTDYFDVAALCNQWCHLCVFSGYRFTPLTLIIDGMNCPETALWGTIHTKYCLVKIMFLLLIYSFIFLSIWTKQSVAF